MNRQTVLLVFISLVSTALAGAQTGQTNSFLTRLGQDTIAAESFTIDANGMRGVSVARSPRVTIREFAAKFDSAGNLEDFHVKSTGSNGSAGTRYYKYSNDSVWVLIKQDASIQRYTVAAKDRPFPFLIDVFAGWQASLQRALGAGKKGFSVLAGKRTIGYSIQETASGNVELSNPDRDFAPIVVELEKGAAIRKFDLTATTDKFIAERVPPLDVLAMANSYMAREKSGGAIGVLSPRDTVRAEINGAHLMIDYGRPSVRGRTIFGSVVRWDSVWRTGANAATQLMTDKELQFGSVVVPPGTYSLFSVPAASKWMLIINTQHGQWGTNYDQSKDLARIPMEVKTRDELVERFTFEVTSKGNEGQIRFMWEHTEGAIPFTVR
jgi:DUF2911 family protein